LMQTSKFQFSFRGLLIVNSRMRSFFLCHKGGRWYKFNCIGLRPWYPRTTNNKNSEDWLRSVNPNCQFWSVMISPIAVSGSQSIGKHGGHFVRLWCFCSDLQLISKLSNKFNRLINWYNLVFRTPLMLIGDDFIMSSVQVQVLVSAIDSHTLLSQSQIS
jgi:hypothetical protein